MPDPFGSLGPVAAVPERLKPILAVTLLVPRDPIVFTEEAATLDDLPAGRLIVGVGNVLDELRNHSVAPAERGKVFDERIDAVKRLWTQERPSSTAPTSTSTPCTAGPRRATRSTPRSS
ncbi:LLM class flavin-dependent oxidoreductase [Amycolatopsis sp. NPDC051903]|uniref:LLM class flavin-dependent oxidoreductase n=1 Tax=Amycolatopsis sp. NPDC051903 TaxID=3363936 RepID=UPI0037924EDE